MPFIDMANVACGFHAGDPVVMQNTVSLARSHGVLIGAHPSYPDLQGFGRRSMQVPAEELMAMLHYQIAALEGIAKVQGAVVSYVKPHGALYNDMMKRPQIMQCVMQAIADYPTRLSLMIQATTAFERHLEEAGKLNVPLLFEAFADRRYQDDGSLTPRTEPGAVLDKTAMLAQAKRFIEDSTVITASNNKLSLKVDSLCVHGDNQEALEGVKAIRAMLGEP